jgi:hypothetical protein
VRLTFDKAPILFEDTIPYRFKNDDEEQTLTRRRYLVTSDIAVDVMKNSAMGHAYLIEDILLSEYTGDELARSGESVIFGSPNVKHYLNTFFKTTKSSKRWVEDKRASLREKQWM